MTRKTGELTSDSPCCVCGHPSSDVIRGEARCLAHTDAGQDVQVISRSVDMESKKIAQATTWANSIRATG
jgi:hypothetical protein